MLLAAPVIVLIEKANSDTNRTDIQIFLYQAKAIVIKLICQNNQYCFTLLIR
jgi:hypothetical protein